MPRLLLLPPGRDASSSQDYPPAVCCWYPFIHLGEEKTQWSKVPRPWEGIQNLINALLKQRSIAWGRPGGGDFFFKLCIIPILQTDERYFLIIRFYRTSKFL